MINFLMNKKTLFSLIVSLSFFCIGLYGHNEVNEDIVLKEGPRSDRANSLLRNSYPVSQFILAYGEAYPDLSSLEEVAELEIELGFQDGVYINPSEGGRPSTIVLGDSPPVSHFSPEALRLDVSVPAAPVIAVISG